AFHRSSSLTNIRPSPRFCVRLSSCLPLLPLTSYLLPPTSDLLPPSQHHQRRVSSRRAHDSAARMRRRAAHVEVLDRGLVLRPPRHGPEKEQLLQRQFTLKDISLRQPPLALEIARWDD